ncbi:hypothetical protein RhiirA1_528036 [Rhizophagus irregularis]|uniref:Uncharacterized protein n=3 Tax=Rhizophagus irregularis TaxID=588596 RepID=A0A2N0SL80_9GLOM|nr:hypothetical protein RhiirA1_528036 [Rhizophagus irregularis]
MDDKVNTDIKNGDPNFHYMLKRFLLDEDNDGVSKSKLSGRLPPHPVKPDKEYHKKEGINSVEDKSDIKYGRQAMEENTELKSRIGELEKNRTDTVAENVELRARVVKLEQDIDELKKELESKKNHKFQKKCILIAQILLNEEPVVEYRPSFMEGLKLDAFF